MKSLLTFFIFLVAQAGNAENDTTRNLMLLNESQIQRSVSVLYEIHQSAYGVEDKSYLKLFRQHIAPPAKVAVMRDGERFVGLVVWTEPLPNKIVIQDIAVAKAHQAQGIGGEMIWQLHANLPDTTAIRFPLVFGAIDAFAESIGARLEQGTVTIRTIDGRNGEYRTRGFSRSRLAEWRDLRASGGDFLGRKWRFERLPDEDRAEFLEVLSKASKEADSRVAVAEPAKPKVVVVQQGPTPGLVKSQKPKESWIDRTLEHDGPVTPQKVAAGVCALLLSPFNSGAGIFRY